MGQALNKPCKWSNHGTTGNKMIYMSMSLGECWEPPPEDIKDIVGGLPRQHSPYRVYHMDSDSSIIPILGNTLVKCSEEPNS
eukprot:COSAG01_NODE_11868_length_1844_cov_6.380516_2_plen_82_part_00